MSNNLNQITKKLHAKGLLDAAEDVGRVIGALTRLLEKAA